MRTQAHALRSIGVGDSQRGAEFLEEIPGDEDEWLAILRTCADPDLAILQASRLHEAHPEILGSFGRADHRKLERLLGVLGASANLGDYLIAHPSQRARALWVEPGPSRTLLLHAVGADPLAAVPVASAQANADDLRRAYRQILLDIVADDVTSTDPLEHMPEVGRRMAELADAALEAALALARRSVDPHGQIPFAVIAMGKTGAQELNYVSDVDVVYVIESDDRESVELGTRLAAHLAGACSGPGAEPPLWTLDANLRPEGRHGVLVRTVESYEAYWRQWAQTWEFQALLKARACAGDPTLGQRFEAAASPFIWDAASHDGFVESARLMRRRVEDHIPRQDIDREIKLGRGGLRDVEFTVQLLQLVHGRTDESLRVRSTLEAIGALANGGYIARHDAAELAHCYRFLRLAEHRAQLPRMRRTHLIPTNPHDLHVMGRAIDPEKFFDADALHAELDRVRTRVRSLHEDMFYRPIVMATSQLSADEASLDQDAAQDRLKVIGYVDPAGALTHIRALTTGTSRRAMIQRHLLPVFISWLAHGADPDLGLLNFRAVSEQIGDSHWYLALLRDSGVAAQRLCQVLPNSRWVAEALSRRPEAIAWLDDNALLESPPVQRLHSEVASLISRHPDPHDAAARVRAVRTRELLRNGLDDSINGIHARRPQICDGADAALTGALEIAMRECEAIGVVDVGIVAMGRYGGREPSYASDADIIAVHRAHNGVDQSQAAAVATHVINTMKSLLGATTNDMSIELDLNLRPEGKSGPMTRTVESYGDYYAKWAATWERQALLRSRPVAGPHDLINEFIECVDAVRYGQPLTHKELTDIRLLKARMETERLPRGAEPARHVKLGPGGLTDVEWVVQLLQLREAGDNEALRTPSTVDAISALVDAGTLSTDDGNDLLNAWELASRIRAGNVLASGRMSGPRIDMLPRETKDFIPLARLMGYSQGRENDLEDEWLRAARRARAVMDRVFWE
ncbi:bifunctional [glutamine synthetase] adenylyltransferase/[glutamine synthetase]-adenylyl-L-tyrosine phosphorylase [Schaalia sp. ZJ405]|uniref:bifunctional [glutamine synthetase] adenylyltransferase/[glutamine synthetase]-adenylyl-L-tyrosine phosphorylase n=1 Tax=Schaalia sp. ZJ405 TaxID=2709403 RepID=UPI0013ED9E52|nr:bifunctional [glutamine synthetase] adenylyltransferase/[glutamine synthetase]-adenylyl-L-tyrosine phosphorylase [Schaalia sp. ZJ405]QPK80530.1 bifunctional [glutamine synthetase] adenylyltransferase/[glutamine synthetase]-adenylyl-L-tyrosine phosphorylase [Schaalia sp. ZJ405]